MQRPFLIVAALLTLVVLVQCRTDEQALNKKLNEMATNLNESTPVMLDQFTRFDEASVTSENVFQYQYTVLHTSNPDSLVKSALQSLKASIQREFSTNPELTLFKENDVVLEYIYKNERGEVISTLQIKPEEYH